MSAFHQDLKIKNNLTSLLSKIYKLMQQDKILAQI